MNRKEYSALLLVLGCSMACSAAGAGSDGDNGGNGASSNSGSSNGATSGSGGPDIDLGGDGPGPEPGGGDDNNPTTCAQAAASQTYIGCDFWPTVTYNPVYSEFAFAVVVANGGAAEADVEVMRGTTSVATAKVPAGGLATIELPWVAELKGSEFTRGDTFNGRRHDSILVPGGAYHMTSSVPVTAWQFSPLHYQQPAANCPGLPANNDVCLSVSNDASLLLPSTAMTGAYRLGGRSARNEGGGEMYGSAQGGFAITATADGTTVDIQLSPDRVAEVGMNAVIGAAVPATGPGIVEAMPGATMTFTLDAGDVLQLVGKWGPFEPEPHGDLSGSLVNSTKPVQIIAFNPLLNGVPGNMDGNPDHIEETVLPAEVIGKAYVVAAPTGPDGRVPGHMVRFFGNFDGTALTYEGTAPAGAPVALDAGEVVEIGPLTDAFSVSADKSFSVVSIMLGGTKQDPGGTRGDPSLTTEITPEQFRTQYTFLAPLSYLENYADILIPTGATVTLDGQPLAGTPEPVAGTTWSLVREPLGEGQDGAHRLDATAKVGLQVMGFGNATSYSYPGGLDLKLISERPVIVK